MYSNENLERFYFKYQTEVLPHGQSLQSFCLNTIFKAVQFGVTLVNFFKKIFEGCRDYPSLLPSCIGLE